jgi:hypothetical protein
MIVVIDPGHAFRRRPWYNGVVRRHIENAMIEHSGSVEAHLEKHYYPDGKNLTTAAALVGYDKRSLHAFLKRRGFLTKGQSECQSGPLNGFYGRKHGEDSLKTIGETSRQRQERMARSAANGRYGNDPLRYTGEAASAFINGIGVYRAKAIDFYGSTCMLCGDSGVVDVHHRDGNRDNNTISNLTVLCKSCHLTHHAKLRKKREVRGQ